MRKLLSILVLLLIAKVGMGSPQRGDLLIVGKDTMEIRVLPLQQTDSGTYKVFRSWLSFYHPNNFSFSLWRGYQGCWQIIDDQLYLVGLANDEHSGDILKQTFGSRYKDGKVLADWFSGEMYVSKGELLRWDGEFGKTYEKEELFSFAKGALRDRRPIENYIRVEHGIARRYDNHVPEVIFREIKKLDWKELSICKCDVARYVFFINDEGRVGKIQYLPYTDKLEDITAHDTCIDNFKRQLKDLQFDIVRWNGKPYDDVYVLELLYTPDGLQETGHLYSAGHE